MAYKRNAKNSKILYCETNTSFLKTQGETRTSYFLKESCGTEFAKEPSKSILEKFLKTTLAPKTSKKNLAPQTPVFARGAGLMF